jgi:hypothetical protein
VQGCHILFKETWEELHDGEYNEVDQIKGATLLLWVKARVWLSKKVNGEVQDQPLLKHWDVLSKIFTTQYLLQGSSIEIKENLIQL